MKESKPAKKQTGLALLEGILEWKSQLSLRMKDNLRKNRCKESTKSYVGESIAIEDILSWHFMIRR